MGSGQPAYDSGKTITAADPEFTLEEWDRVLTKLGECQTEEDELLYDKAHSIKISEMKRRFINATCEALGESKSFWKQMVENLAELDAKIEALVRVSSPTIDEKIDLRIDIDNTIEEISAMISNEENDKKRRNEVGYD